MIEELIIYKKYNDFIYYVYLLLDKIPKYEKSSIALDIRNKLILNLELIIKLYKKNNKVKYLEELDINLLILKNLVRVIYKRKYISIKNYKSFSKKITEISNLVGGYYKKY